MNVKHIQDMLINGTRIRSTIMNNEEIFRLAKPKKKGILPLIFSRFLVIVLLLVLQVMLMVGFYGWLGEYIPYLTVIL